MTEVRNQHEGTLGWILASGSGSSFVTASGGSGVLMAYVQSFTWTSAKTYVPIFDRGNLSHWKATDNGQPVTLSFAVLYAITGNWPTAIPSGSGATVPMVHLEFKMTAAEAGAGLFYRFHGCPVDQLQFGEEANANTQTINMRALSMFGPTGSGYVLP